MKRIITLLTLFAFIKGNSQCVAPSNFVYSIVNNQDALLSWTENGNANTWEIVAVADFYVGAPLPSAGSYITSGSPFVYNSIPPGCIVFFVRSLCSETEVSSWIAVTSSECTTDINNYLATLSNDNFSSSSEKSRLQLFPNPAKSVIELEINTKIDKLTLFDATGKVILMQTQNNNKIDIANLSKGIYFIEVYTENEKFFRKFVKE